MSFIGVLRGISAKLDRADIPYMLTRSFAAAYFGHTRATQDIDIVIAPDPEQLRALVASLPSSEYYVVLRDAIDAHRQQSMFNIIDMATCWKIDMIFQKRDPFHLQAFQRRKRVTFEDVPTWVISPEDLIISKLEWSRLGESERQIRDAAVVLQKRSPEIDRNYLESWVKELQLAPQWNSALQFAGIA